MISIAISPYYDFSRCLPFSPPLVCHPPPPGCNHIILLYHYHQILWGSGFQNPTIFWMKKIVITLPFLLHCTLYLTFNPSAKEINSSKYSMWIYIILYTSIKSFLSLLCYKENNLSVSNFSSLLKLSYLGSIPINLPCQCDHIFYVICWPER